MTSSDQRSHSATTRRPHGCDHHGTRKRKEYKVKPFGFASVDDLRKYYFVKGDAWGRHWTNPVISESTILGVGSFGTVRKVQKIGTREYYAVKGISKAKIKGHEDELLSEIASWRCLSGSLNVVKLYSVYEDYYNVYILMEICAGGELLSKLEEGNITEALAAQYVREIIYVIRHCQEQGVVHRDIKPGNFLFLNDKRDSPLKLCDFGFAVRIMENHDAPEGKHGSIESLAPPENSAGVESDGDPESRRGARKLPKRSSTHEICGTPPYIAPEVLSSFTYGHKSDLWAAGCMTFEILTGQILFLPEKLSHQLSAKVLFRMIKTVPVIKIIQDYHKKPWSKISPRGQDFIMKLLKKDPSERMSCDEALHHPWIREEMPNPEEPLQVHFVSRAQDFGVRIFFRQLVYHRIAKKMLALADTRTDLKPLESLRASSYGSNLSELSTQATEVEQFDPENELRLVQEDEIETMRRELRECGFKERVERMKELFDRIDVAKEGTLTYSELLSFIKKSHYVLNYDEMKTIIAHMDIDNSGIVNFDEFVAVMFDWESEQKRLPSKLWERLLLQIYEELDTDKTKTLNRRNIEDALGSRFSSRSDSLTELDLQFETNLTLRRGDTTGDGAVDFEGFLKLTNPNMTLRAFNSRLPVKERNKIIRKIEERKEVIRHQPGDVQKTTVLVNGQMPGSTQTLEKKTNAGFWSCFGCC